MTFHFFGSDKTRHKKSSSSSDKKNPSRPSRSSSRPSQPQPVPQQPPRPNAPYARPTPAVAASPPPYGNARPPPPAPVWTPPLPSYQQHIDQQQRQQYLQPWPQQRANSLTAATQQQPFHPLHQNHSTTSITYRPSPPPHLYPAPHNPTARPAYHSATSLPLATTRPATSPSPNPHPTKPPPGPQFYIKTQAPSPLSLPLPAPVKKASASMQNLQMTLLSTVEGTAEITAGLWGFADAWCEMVAGRFDEMITGMDGEEWTAEGGEREGALDRTTTPRNLYAKVWRYQNARLPPHQRPFKVYISTWPLISMAASYSEKVYSAPRHRAEKKMYVHGDAKMGTRPMFLKSVIKDDMKVIVLAIRGTKRFRDWCVNFRDRGVSADGFLDDAANNCHGGFLDVAQRMLKPIAEHLKALLAENPSRSNCSLLLTGHSAGGAVAALLYAHMTSRRVVSDLHHLTGFFKRVHCITFGTPPTSLRPLEKPRGSRYQKSLFVTFVNEGDPVSRADRSMLTNLLLLYKQAAPKPGAVVRWDVPSGSMSLPGTVVVLRIKPGVEGAVLGVKYVEAVQVKDEAMRQVVYGDPLAHQMVLYEKRVKELAARTATAENY